MMTLLYANICINPKASSSYSHHTVLSRKLDFMQLKIKKKLLIIQTSRSRQSSITHHPMYWSANQRRDLDQIECLCHNVACTVSTRKPAKSS